MPSMKTAVRASKDPEPKRSGKKTVRATNERLLDEWDNCFEHQPHRLGLEHYGPWIDYLSALPPAKKEHFRRGLIWA